MLQKHYQITNLLANIIAIILSRICRFFFKTVRLYRASFICVTTFPMFIYIGDQGLVLYVQNRG